MHENWMRNWLREQVSQAQAAATPAVTQYNVAGVPVSVTGAHVAVVFVAAPASTATGEHEP
jgi:hypothetical protein